MDNFMEMEIQPNRLPIECFWDQSDPRLLAVETEYIKDLVSSAPTDPKSPQGGAGKIEETKVGDVTTHPDDARKKEDDFTGKTLETFFVTTDYKVKR